MPRTKRLYKTLRSQRAILDLLRRYSMPSWELERPEIRIIEEKLMPKGLVVKIDYGSCWLYMTKERYEKRVLENREL